MKWRAIPTALLLGFALELVYQVVSVGLSFAHDDGRAPERWQLIARGLDVAVMLLMVLGTREMALRATGRVALGLRVAAYGWIGSLVTLFAWQWWLAVSPPGGDSIESYVSIVMWIFFGFAFAVPLGLGYALWRTQPRLAVVGVVVAFLAHPPELVTKFLFGWVDGGYRTVMAFFAVTSVIRLVAIFAMAAALATPATPDAALAAYGFRQAAAALRLRVFAAIAVTLLTMIAVAGTSSEGAMKLALVSGSVINIAAFLLIANGVLAAARGAIADLSRWSLVVAGAMSLWCAGVMLAQLEALYQLLFRKEHSESFAAAAQALPVATPLIAMASGAIVAVAIGSFAGRRGLDELRGEASSKGITFVVLLLASLGIQNWMLQGTKSFGAGIAMMLATAVSGLVALVILARLCDRAATAVESEQALPIATVVSDRT